jgi:hypothetical protein
MASWELHVTERYARVEGGHDERSSKHVRMHGAQPGTLADRANPPVRGTSIEPLPVAATQDGPLTTFRPRLGRSCEQSRGTSGIVAGGLFPLPTIRSVR